RISSWAMMRLATVSSTGVPRKMMRSLASREYGSHSMRPRGVSWMNRGIGTYWLRIGSLTVSGSFLGGLVRRLVGRVGVFGCVVFGCGVGGELQRKRDVDHVSGVVDHGCVIDEELERLPARDIRAYRLQHTSSFEVAPHLLGLLLEALGEPLDLGVDLRVGGRDLFLRNYRAQRQVAEHRLHRAFAHLVDERLG